jgi:hypothetical protein
MFRRTGMFARTRMFAVMGALLLSQGCMHARIIRLSSLAQANVVQLEDGGDPEREGDETLFVLDEPADRDKVTAFLKERSEFWRPTGDVPRPARYTLSFRKNGESTDVFWINRGRVETMDASGTTYAITLSDAEVDQLVELFHWTRNFKTQK